VLSFRSLFAIAAATTFGALPGLAHAQLNLLCSAPAEWCKLLADEFQKDTGIKVGLANTGGRAALATLAEQKGKPQADVWFGGSAEGHSRAGKFALIDEYASPVATQLQPWAQKVAEQSKNQSYGVYARVLGIGYNSTLAAQKKLAPPACWKDLVKPGYAAEVHMADPNTSGSSYLAIASMTQVFGEDEAFKNLKAMYKAQPAGKKARPGIDDKAIPQGGAAAAAGKGAQVGKGAQAGKGGNWKGARAEAAKAETVKAPPPVGNAIAGIGYIGDIVAEAEGGAPVKAVTPCEGTIFEVGAVSIVKGARNLDNAKKFVDWALGAKAQGLAAKAKVYAYPANTATAASPLAPKFGDIKFINYDVAKFEKSAARRHLIDRWQSEINPSSP
jgi:iron(III) transport system substrate-binding protein